VPLCRDRQGVDREAVHADLAARILAFFLAVM
jgi:predicted dienelactone hydrolase